MGRRHQDAAAGADEPKGPQLHPGDLPSDRGRDQGPETNGPGQKAQLLLMWQQRPLKYFSLAIDESTDVSNTAQLAVFVRGIDEDLKRTVLIAFAAYYFQEHRQIK